MITMNLERLQYPIGKFQTPDSINDQQLNEWIETIANFPLKIAEMCGSLSEESLNWVYRPDGWTIKQVVHHCGDSHINSFIRFKLALTEDEPTIKPYHENLWAELEDSLDNDISYSLELLKALHYRWVRLLHSLSSEQLLRQFVHPEHGKKFTLGETIANYAWHCNHHQAHIEQAIFHKGQF